MISTILVGIFAVLGGIIFGYFTRQSIAKRQEDNLESRLNKRINNANKQAGITTVITADHGNAEEMINTKTGGIITHHSSNPVPFIVVGKDFKAHHPNKPLHLKKAQNILADVAPTILHIMGIEKPPQMSGVSMLT